MAFDGVFLHRLLKEDIIPLTSGRISKITESGDTDFIFTIRYERVNYNLMLSLSSNYSRIHLTNKDYQQRTTPKSFTLLLKKHLEGYIIKRIEQHTGDRVVMFTLEGRNEMQDLNTKYLIAEIMGRYSNLVLTDSKYKIIDSLKHDGVGEYNRTILPNAIYEFPKNDKITVIEIFDEETFSQIFKERKVNNAKDLVDNFTGISRFFANIIFNSENPARNMYDKFLVDTIPSTFINDDGKLDYYFNPFDYKVVNKYKSLSELLDEYYYEMDIKSKIKAKTDDLSSFISRELNKYEKKKIKLEQELRDKNDIPRYKTYGELLLTTSDLKKKDSEIVVFNYYENKDVKIPLDIRYTILENSNMYFKKYAKAKTSIRYIKEQIQITDSEIEYFTLLKYQLNDCNLNDAMEIQEELINNKYLFKQKEKNKKIEKPKLLTYKINNSLISVGKNNIQNDYLTNKKSRPSEYWFHVKKMEGAHVVIHKSEDLTEDEIRACANLAALHSAYKDSSSVPVDYTRIKYIKKIPGKKGCFVSYTHEKTIYIDPDINLVNDLEVKR